MARTSITVTKPAVAGSTLSFVAADGTNGMDYVNSGEEKLIVKNDAASSITVTVKSVPCSHGRTKDEVFTVNAAQQKILGPFDEHLFNNKGKVEVDFSAAASVTVAVLG